MKKIYSVILTIFMLPLLANAAENMAFHKDGRTSTYQLTEERLRVSDRIINPNEAVKGVDINSDSYSIGVWVNLDKYLNINNLVNEMVLMSYTPSHHLNTNGTWSVLVTKDGHLKIGGYGRYHTTNPTSTATISLNEWHHVMFVYDADAQQYALYLDGESLGTWTAKEKFNWLDEHPCFTFAGWEYSGDMDEVQIYNKALTADEVADVKKSATSVDGLAALYTLDEVAEGTTTQFANQAEGGENYNLICETATVDKGNSYYIWNNGMPFLQPSSESASTYGSLAETAPTMVAGRELPVDKSYEFSVMGIFASVEIYSDAALTNLVMATTGAEDGDDFAVTESQIADGLYIKVIPEAGYELSYLYFDGSTMEVNENVCHVALADIDYNEADGPVNIIAVCEESLAGISEVAVDLNSADVEYFNLQGIRVAAENLTSGLYVARQGEKAVKVIIKK